MFSIVGLVFSAFPWFMCMFNCLDVNLTSFGMIELRLNYSIFYFAISPFIT